MATWANRKRAGRKAKKKAKARYVPKR